MLVEARRRTVVARRAQARRGALIRRAPPRRRPGSPGCRTSASTPSTRRCGVSGGDRHGHPADRVDGLPRRRRGRRRARRPGPSSRMPRTTSARIDSAISGAVRAPMSSPTWRVHPARSSSGRSSSSSSACAARAAARPARRSRRPASSAARIAPGSSPPWLRRPPRRPRRPARALGGPVDDEAERRRQRRPPPRRSATMPTRWSSGDGQQRLEEDLQRPAGQARVDHDAARRATPGSASSPSGQHPQQHASRRSRSAPSAAVRTEPRRTGRRRSPRSSRRRARSRRSPACAERRLLGAHHRRLHERHARPGQLVDRASASSRSSSLLAQIGGVGVALHGVPHPRRGAAACRRAGPRTA